MNITDKHREFAKAVFERDDIARAYIHHCEPVAEIDEGKLASLAAEHFPNSSDTILKQAEEALDGRLDNILDIHPVVSACRQYVKSEDALPDDFDSEEYSLSNSVESLARTYREHHDPYTIPVPRELLEKCKAWMEKHAEEMADTDNGYGPLWNDIKTVEGLLG